MKAILICLGLLLLSTFPVLGVTEQTVPALAAPAGGEASAPAPKPEGPASGDPTTVQLPTPIEDVVWLCTAGQNQQCNDICAGDPDCIGCVAVCRGLTF